MKPDADAGTLDKWIPNDNPFNVALGVQSAVWVTGIRNNQGFAYDTALNKLYGSSHGPYSDDEINVIEQGRNYGHPLVIGKSADGNYNGITAGSPLPTAGGVSTCPVITDEVTNATTIGPTYKDPLFSAYPSTNAALTTIWNTNPNNAGWPSEGWSGLELYTQGIVPGWKKSLIATSLKWGRLVKIRLYSNGDSVVKSGGQDTVSYFGSTNRFRDLAIESNGKNLYVIMDKSTTTSGPSANFPVVPACPGCLQKYSFLGYADVAGKSNIPNTIDVSSGVDNSCAAGTTVDISGANTNYWVPITGPDGNIMAEIYANGQTWHCYFFIL
ncbi:MAG: PQQ-dependent sugar dehydrogenase [Chitinophagaceae bacterium]|nr:PQQ-dependent sugar dehydrogenase [Chitinophagaceae bacterium]